MMKPLIDRRTSVPLLILVAIAAGFLGSTEAKADDLLVRSRGAWFYGPSAMWTLGSTSTEHFFPLSEPVATVGLVRARFSYQLTQDSGDCKLRPAVRFSDDQITWAGHKEVETTWADANNEIIYSSGWVDLNNITGLPPAAYIQFGLEVVNRSTSTTSFCYGTLRVEPGLE